MKRIIVITTLVLCAVAGAGIATVSAKPYPDLPNTPAFTSRYPAVANTLDQQQQIDALREEVRVLRGQVGVLQLLRAHDISQRDVMISQVWQNWQAARTEDNKRLSSVEWSVNTLWSGCR